MKEHKKDISIRGAKVHNLKSLNVVIPQNQLVVITGVSGSGKSSLAFDTIYAEGQRRYVESLSAYARQFLGRMSKPEVDFISGIPPAIAIEQKVNTRNPRSTVGTSTEIYDYLRLLYSRIGRTYSPVSGKEVKRHSVDDVVKYISSLKAGSRVLILSPSFLPHGIDAKTFFKFLIEQGFTRIRCKNGEVIRVDNSKPDCLPAEGELFHIVVDRLVAGTSDEEASRYADSVETAILTGSGKCSIEIMDSNDLHDFSTKFEADGIMFEEPTEHLFSFNNPLGACPLCEGYSRIIGIDEELVIPDQNLSVYEDAIVCWKGEKMKKWKERLVMNASKFDFPIHKPWYQLSEDHKSLVWTGNRYFYGLNRFFEYLEEKKYKIQYRVMLSRYRGKTTCPECRGNRLRKEASYVKVNSYAIWELTSMPVSVLLEFVNTIKLSRTEKDIADRILLEIKSRLRFLNDVGLGYLTLNRLSSSLSGGESQRINIATSLGSSLVGSLYILDEPSIGLHPRDTKLLISVLKNLRNIGNTVLVVEHEEEIIRSADRLIDIGPEAGRFGGELVYEGKPSDIKSGSSLTCRYLKGELTIPVPSLRRRWNSYIGIEGARENNLKEIDVKIPLNTITVVTGVSGSGKSTLVSSILYPALKNSIEGYGSKPGKFKSLSGDYLSINGVELVDQNPIGKSSRSNPVTYLKAYDEIRKLFADQQLSRQNSYKASHFSFNVDGGRCEECQGEGTIKVEMQFMADVELECEECKGKRFKKEILEVMFNNKNIHDVLEMTINEAIEFFSQAGSRVAGKITRKLQPLADVGLGYVKLGQSSSTLSGGESQRVKLAYYLSQENSERHILFIFDEPTTGLHFHDINKLLNSLNALVEKGHSVLLIEHNLEMIKNADWIIDLGPGGGDEGGSLIFEGVPEEIVNCTASSTGIFLKNKI
ncbi:MAG: excinuclease ABC subunit UvrA [Marinilabiliaceae bacterium]|jgi:excinuclease ABC subunit A|nr:excinuclease ABC subunit UvrA [Marinilabiliaceae bacterium]